MQYDTTFSLGDLGKKIGKIRYHYFKNWDFKKMLKVKSVYLTGWSRSR